MYAQQACLPGNLNLLAPVVVDDLVRIGNLKDGGYVLPEFLLTHTDVLLAMGVNDDWSFEAAFVKANAALEIHAYDHTISKRIFSIGILVASARFMLGKSNILEIIRRIRLLGAYKSFFKGNVKHFQERVHNRLDTGNDANFQKIFDRIKSDKVFIKMDIEGSEYRLIDDVLSRSSRITGLVVEFHDTDPLRMVFLEAIKKLQTVYSIVHIHGNNYGPACGDGLPEFLEITFIRKDFLASDNKRSELPISGLDYPNDPTHKDFPMRFAL